ncbi:MAG: flagellar M-ring protein FliF [Deltaproteobacteria bacterium]|nr:flagellar M-ring protein FliF [Deltaproteobacteria bacterium]
MPANEVNSQFQKAFKSLSWAQKITLLLLVGGTVLLFTFLILWTGKPEYQLLYSNLAPEDAGNILAKLKEQKIPYKIPSYGNSILIPEERIYEMRLVLASQGLPQGSGVGFEVFDNTKLGMTEFVQNVNYQRALQGELARTINGFAEVESARVHIVMPTKSLFVEEEEPATASVVIKLRSGRTLGKSQIQGIVHLVSSGVSGLRPEKVAVVDSNGKVLSGARDESDLGQITSDQLDLQKTMERGLEERITTMLEKALGPGKAIARVSCLMDFGKYEKTEERYDPDNRVIRSEQLFNENSNGWEPVPVGIPGVAANVAEEKPVMRAGNVNSNFQKQDKTVNYEIGKVTSHSVEPVGKINKLSVAVIVDGTYKVIDGEGGEREEAYYPRTQEEMGKLENIVKSAVNFDGSRGDNVEVINIPFEGAKALTDVDDMQSGDEQSSWISYVKLFIPVIKTGFLAIFLFLSFIFVVRPVMEWITANSRMGPDLISELPKTVSEIEREYGGAKKLPFRDQALEVIRKNNEGSVQLMKEWLKGSKV